MAENVRETELGLLFGGEAAPADGADLTAIMANAARRRRSKYVDLSGQAKLWFVTGVRGAGKTMIARWLFWRAIAGDDTRPWRRWGRKRKA
jgi:hypothetical protein